MQTAFERALEFTLQFEGGYVNDPADRGGETNFGISKRAHPTVDIKNLTREGASTIYFVHYWRKIGGESLAPATATAVFDFAVNSGVPRASRALQRAIGTRADGDVGPNTLQAAQTILSGPRSTQDPWMAHETTQHAVQRLRDHALAHHIQSQRIRLLTGFVAAQPTQAKFLRGWMNRVMELTRLIEAI